MATIEFSSGPDKIHADLFAPPTGSKNGGAIVIAYGSDGLTDRLNGPWKTMIEGYAKDLAKSGFVSLIPHYFEKTKTEPGIPAAHRIPIFRDEWETALADSVTYAKKLPDIDPSRIGLLGFSLGGHLCLRIRDRAKVLVEYFSPEFKLMGGIGANSNPALKVQIHHGEDDRLPATIFPYAVSIKEKLESEAANVELFAYPGANHGFRGDDLPNKQARDRSKTRTLSFFKSHLK